MAATSVRYIESVHSQMLPSVSGHSFVGILIFMEYHRRILKGEFGSIPEAIKIDSFAQGGYCIDAPEIMPAGSCESMQIDEEMWGVDQTHVYREPQ